MNPYHQQIDTPGHNESMGNSFSSQQYKSYFSKGQHHAGGTVHHQTSKFVVDQYKEVVIMGAANTERKGGAGLMNDSHNQEPLLQLKVDKGSKHN